MKLLYAEDEPALSEAVVDYLTYHKYIVDAVYDGADAYDYAMSGEYDGIILDIMMPGMDGPEVFRRMQEDERTQGIPVFFMTAVTDRDRVLECMEMNPEEYLVKPVSSSKLLKKLSDLFEKES